MPFRNVETHFSKAPQANIKRSAFKYNFGNKFTFNVGDLVPFMVEEVLPGDTFDLKLSKVVRLTTSLHPTMDNLYLDTYFFFVPNRLIWDNWQAFMGENDKAWAQTVEHVPPSIKLGSTDSSAEASLRFGYIQPQSILNYLGLPVFTNGDKDIYDVTNLDFNAYVKIWNDWFRSENLIDECPFYTGDGLVPKSYHFGYKDFLKNFGIAADVYPSDSNSCLKVAKFADYFTRSLPKPQKGNDVLIPAGSTSIGVADWIEDDDTWDYDNQPRFHFYDGGTSSEFGTLYSSAQTTTGEADSYGISTESTDAQASGMYYDPAGTLELKGLEITVNNLRLAMQTQKLLERDARGGTRYIELIRSHFGVKSPDARLQRSEYLGGKRTLINMSEVIQTSESSASSPLGNLGGRSITTGVEDSFIKSFVEHGYIIGVCCARPDRTYSQGLPRRYFRFDRLNYYFPVLANIGEQPVYDREIFMTKDTDVYHDPESVFGYQEAWAEYRTQQSRLAGYMQPGITGSLASWSYADNYTTGPFLSAGWLYQGKSEVDRTLAVPSSTAPQFIADFMIYGKMVRPMPVYSIPGLVDHN